MKRLFGFSMALAAAIGLAATAFAQTGGAGGAGGAGGSGGASASGATGTSGAAGAAGTAGVGAAATGAGASGSANRGGAGGVTTGTNPASSPANPGVRPGANNGVGAANGLGSRNGINSSNGFGADNTGRFNANANAAARTGRNNLGPNSETVNGNGFNNGISQTPFFNDPAVRRELRLNDTQFNGLSRAYQDAYGAYNQGVDKLGNNLTPDQRAQRMEQLENSFNNSFNGALDSNLTDTQARMRFDQLNRQYMGLSAFNNPAIQSQLHLTPQQRQQIRALATQWRDQQGTNVGTNGPNYSQYSKQLNSILTPQQQQTWSQLTGTRFNFGVSANGSTHPGVDNGTGAGAGTTNTGTEVVGNPGERTRPTDPRNNVTPKSGNAAPFGGAGSNGSSTSGAAGSSGGSSR